MLGLPEISRRIVLEGFFVGLNKNWALEECKQGLEGIYFVISSQGY